MYLTPLSTQQESHILHIDGDAFFVSCETASRPYLKGKPVVTGKERGIASAMSYEAKARGVTRGMSVYYIKKICPEAVIIPSDYDTYNIFSSRMLTIVGKYTSMVEPYSIDECFADLSYRFGRKRSCEETARLIKEELYRSLGITFSVGVGATKTIAKTASNAHKPDSLTIFSKVDLVAYLKQLPIGKVWGIGPQTSSFLFRERVLTAFDFIQKEKWWIQEKLPKPYYDLWQELRGIPVFKVHSDKTPYKSIQKVATFRPPSQDKAFLFSELSRNVENACHRLRENHLVASEMSFFLKTQSFGYHGRSVRLAGATCTPQEVLQAITESFDEVFRSEVSYRATGVVLRQLTASGVRQLDLFGRDKKEDALAEIYRSLDRLSIKYGGASIFLGSSLSAGAKSKKSPDSRRQKSFNKRFSLPFLGEVW